MSYMRLHQYTQEIKAGYHPREVAKSKGGCSKAPHVHSLSKGLEPHLSQREMGFDKDMCLYEKTYRLTLQFIEAIIQSKLCKYSTTKC